MTDPTSSSPAPADWYADPAGTPQQRYWDGGRWTEQLRSAAPDAGVPRYEPYRPQVEAAPAGTNVTTPWIWVVVLLPVLSIIGFLVWDIRGYYEATFSSLESPVGSPIVNPILPDASTIVVSLLGWLVYLLTPLFAFLDWRALRARGVVKPFHWAWAFLFTPTYVIGRSVIVKRRSGGGLLPLWVFIGVAVVYVVVYLVKIVDALSVVTTYLPTS